MELSYILKLLGGLALFMYGMHMMSNGLEQTAGDKLKSILEKLTKNRFLAILVGTGITAVIQSSSATTVMVIGFVNSGLMKLHKAVWIIMGANIGTTITGQLIALDIKMIAPIFAIIGTFMVTFLKNKKANHLGDVIAGLGILFIGMDFMGSAMSPLKDNPAFVQLMTTFSNPIYGILAGAIFTAIIQSSSASIGILQTLASQKLIPLQSSAFVLFGQNMGTCVTAFLAAFGANRNPMRTSLIHLLFNFIGTFAFLIICLATPFISFVENLTPNSPIAQVANIHTIFNIATTLLILPFGEKLADITLRLLPILPEEKTFSTTMVNDISLGASNIAVAELNTYLRQMFQTTRKSFESISATYLLGAKCDVDYIRKNEDYINSLNLQISEFMTKLSYLDLQESDQQRCNLIFKLAFDVERIGDHIINLQEYGVMLNHKEILFEASIQKEMEQMKENIEQTYQILQTETLYQKKTKLEEIEQLEQDMDDMCRLFRKNQIKRLKNEESDPKTTVIYSDLLTNMERIGDHMMNLAQALYNVDVDLQYSK
ncbi:MAG: Na/Pi cotransporter family protein [Erysipelotrichaceae bacterium]|nr:Na/Pi cotransporter family protein [Erysipelotrichaceae bacterium]